MKVLYTTPILEYPPAGGPFLRMNNAIKALGNIVDLHLISGASKQNIGGKIAEEFYKETCSSFFYLPSVAQKCKNSIFQRIKNRFYSLNLFMNNSLEKNRITLVDARFIVDYATKNYCKIIWFGYGCISSDLVVKVKELDSSLKIICDTDSVHSRFVLRKLAYENRTKERKKIINEGIKQVCNEYLFSMSSDVVLAVSDFDSEYYKQISDDKNKVYLFSNVIDIDCYKTKYYLSKKLKKPYIYLAGYFGHGSPMNFGARWFVNKVFPLIKNEKSDVHFYIVGKNSDKTLFDIVDESITIVGQVKTVLPYLQNADVAIVPLFFESGTRFKILEAAACEIPIVSTSLGAEGLNLIHNEHLVLADTPTCFADGVINLINNKKFAKVIAKNCNDIIKKFYGIDNLILEGKKIIQYIENIS